jgi:hypothetical protein
VERRSWGGAKLNLNSKQFFLMIQFFSLPFIFMFASSGQLKYNTAEKPCGKRKYRCHRNRNKKRIALLCEQKRFPGRL